MKINKIVYIIFATLMLTACNNDDAPETTSSIAFSVPIEIVTSNLPTNGSRVTGDPGLNDELPPPSCLYFFAWMQSTATKYELIYKSITGLTTDYWTYSLGTDSEDKNSRYKLKNNAVLPFKTSVLTQANGTQIGRIYVIASSKALDNTQLQAITTATYQSVLTSTEAVSFTSSPDATLQAATASFADWTSLDLRDLYSNPIGDDAVDANNVGNGRVVFDSNAEGGIQCGTIRLYHCAAKIDYTWEIDKAQQTTTSVNSITVKSLPTTCKVFEPTKNPSTTVTTQNITATTDTKWLGRGYFYALQPQNGSLTYDVDFNGSHADITDRTFTPSSLNPTFTGWYRVIATVQP